MVYLNITIPEDLKEELDKEVAQQHTKRSTLIQKAVRTYLELKKRQKDSELLKEGYTEMYEDSKKMVDEFKDLDEDSLKYVD